MNDLVDVEVAEALATLRRRYPTEQVKITVAIDNDKTQYTACVCAPDGYSDAEYGWNADCHGAVEHLIQRAGDRSPENRKRLRIAKLQAELRSLGAEPMGDNESAQPHERCGL